MTFKTTSAFAIAMTSVMAACSSAGDASHDVGDLGVSTSRDHALTISFAQAAEHAGVPRDLLVATAHVEDGLGLPARRLVVEEDSAVTAAGPLLLRRGKLDTLARAALLSGKTELELREDSDLALGAGALVLAELGART